MLTRRSLGARSVLARRSLGARSVLVVFEGAWVLKSEHMLGIDAPRVLSEHQGITE